MRKGAFSKKMLSVLLAGSMVVGSASVLSGCGTKKKNGVVKLDVYSQLANITKSVTKFRRINSK